MHLSLPETIEKSIVLQDLEPSLAELDLPDLDPTRSCSFAVANITTTSLAQWTQPSTSTQALNPRQNISIGSQILVDQNIDAMTFTINDNVTQQTENLFENNFMIK